MPEQNSSTALTHHLAAFHSADTSSNAESDEEDEEDMEASLVLQRIQDGDEEEQGM